MSSLRPMARVLALATALTWSSGCEMSRLVSPGDFARLDAAEARWLSRPFPDYAYEIRTICFCPAEMNRWTRVTVRGGVVITADPVETDPAFPVSTLSLWQPIDSVFSRLRQAMRDPSSQDFYERIDVAYDDALGYPTRIEYRAKQTIADGDATLELRNVQPLP